LNVGYRIGFDVSVGTDELNLAGVPAQKCAVQRLTVPQIQCIGGQRRSCYQKQPQGQSQGAYGLHEISFKIPELTRATVPIIAN
jgi:hypothetical protein